jgi:hypothetical protein
MKTYSQNVDVVQSENQSFSIGQRASKKRFSKDKK